MTHPPAAHLRFQYDPALPITAHRDEIAEALARHPVIIVCGATGSGKTTQLPKLCLELGRGTQGLIGHTQPRRIAARAIASRLAAELGTTVGGAVGFQVRFTDRTSRQSRIKVMTDGILLKELERDRRLARYDTLIIDEAHERSLNIDFLLGVLKRLLPVRPDLRLIITSATIDPGRFAAFFGGAPVIEVSGRSHPVETRYRPLVPEDPEDEESTVLSLPEGVVAAVRELDADPRGRSGDTLVFLPGEKQIREAAEALGKANLSGTEILPLYGRLATQEQDRIFARHSVRRIVLATNVAETSLTVPGIRHVIDSGLARISRYSVRGKVQRLPIEPVSQASADQRLGRCGREAEGICIRLYSQADFDLRPAFTPPEVLRTNLASVILQMAVLGLGDPEDFPFIDPPDARLVNDGYRLLRELKAVDEGRQVTTLGRQVAALPLDPRLARMLIAASHHACLAEMLVVTALLSGQDPRERPSDAQAKADESHARFADPRSDFMSVLKLWTEFREQAEKLSGSALRRWCRENFLSYVRLREWQDLHAQLAAAAGELKLRTNSTPCGYADLHQAILTGFLGSIGTLDERREYLGARGTRFVIAPGTSLAGRTPRWVVAGSLVETTRLYARMVAAVEPGWIEAAGSHLLSRSYSEPHWVEERGFVAAFESVSLYGLVLAARRRINFGSVDPVAARAIFIREALVEGRSRLRTGFLDANRRTRAEVERIEARIRRRDVLVDEEAECAFYAERLPAHIHSVAAFERWWRDAGPDERHRLQMGRADLMAREVDADELAQYPDTFELAGNRLPLAYRFEPGTDDDGVTLTVPAPLLRDLSPGRLAWLVPGLLPEKVTAMLRALPKALRKAFVPVPDHVSLCLREIGPADDRDFNEVLAEWVSRRAGDPVTAEAIAALPLPDHLRMNVEVRDLEGRLVATGRDFAVLRRQVREAPGLASAGREQPSGVAKSWDFGELPVERTVVRQGLTFTVYPALAATADGVRLVECGSPHEAADEIRQGLLRLAMLALPQQVKYARKRFADQRELVLSGTLLATDRPLADLLAERAFTDAFLPADAALPRSADAFDRMLGSGRERLADSLDRVEGLALSLLRELKEVRRRLAALTHPSCLPAVRDVRQQLDGLLPANGLASIPTARLEHYPRYLKAIVRRLDRLPAGAARDAQLLAAIQPFLDGWRQLAAAAGRGAGPEVESLRWLLEEFRVSQFAQDLRTAVPVSVKRLATQLDRARAEAARS